MTEAAGQEQGLVEPSLALPPGMKRDRSQKIWRAGRQPGRIHPGHELRQRARERAAPPELEGVHGLASDLVVAHRGPGIRERRRATPAPATEGPHVRRWSAVQCRGTGEGQAAHAAAWGNDAVEGLPADAAERIATALAEAPLADRAERREDEIEQCGDPDPPARPILDGRRYGRAVFQR